MAPLDGSPAGAVGVDLLEAAVVVLLFALTGDIVVEKDATKLGELGGVIAGTSPSEGKELCESVMV